MLNMNKAGIDLPIVKNEDVFYKFFKLSGSNSLAVDGSVTNKIFTLEDFEQPTKIIVTRVDFLIAEDAIIDVNKFGSLPALTNGLDFTFNGDVTFKNNADIMLFASDASISSVKFGVTESSIINGHWDVRKSFFGGLVSNSSDFKITVKDNLSSLLAFKVSVSGIKLEG